MTSPRVSVLIAAHDAAAFLQPTLDSVLDQTFGDLEVLVVDDGSRDGTAGVVRRDEHADARRRHASAVTSRRHAELGRQWRQALYSGGPSATVRQRNPVASSSAKVAATSVVSPSPRHAWRRPPPKGEYSRRV